MKSIIEVENLVKMYKTHKAVNNISFVVKKGEILGFLGPNGAGKSTTINILSTVLKPDDGQINFFGEDINNNIFNFYYYYFIIWM